MRTGASIIGGSPIKGNGKGEMRNSANKMRNTGSGFNASPEKKKNLPLLKV